jgi:uncharacterized protein YbbK (DUF523 family)
MARQRTPRILVSACLLGERVRYTGGAATCDDPILLRWLAEGRVVPFCPEMAGGLGAPRPPAERQGLRAVVTVTGVDVTEAFELGAALAVEICRLHAISTAVLKDGSPSCGSSYVYDGTFRGVRVAGAGITAARLTARGIRVFNEDELAAADQYLTTIASGE